MTDPDDYNTEWILKKLTEQCNNICNRRNQTNPLIIILLTSKNRFGARIDVDRIHRELFKAFPGKIVTIVDACQDGQSYQDADVIIYSKRFTTTGAICLINKRLSKEHNELRKNMMLPTSFPVNILAQLYCTINMMNSNVAFGMEDLLNSANWHDYSSSVLKELRSVFNSYHQEENSSSSIKISEKHVQFEFTEDETGTIVIIRLINIQNEDELLSCLTSKLKEQGHTFDSFLINDPLMKSKNAVNLKEVIELIQNNDLIKLRAVEARSNAYLAWPLVPFSVNKSYNDSIIQENFNRCQPYHRCLRISIDRSGHPGKVKRFVDILLQALDDIIIKRNIGESQNFISHSSQWPSRA
ncbi:hypothetical protein I4U23_004670 [Adineta vaga]|nr:hypothetical protein I4U23_004670 [Adineta vaga]